MVLRYVRSDCGLACWTGHGRVKFEDIVYSWREAVCDPL